MKLKINEIFMSLQGEGNRVGEPSIFIRFSNCNLSCKYCDSEWVTGYTLNIHTLHDAIKKYDCQWLIFTGGEPLLQLNTEIVSFFKNLGYKQAIETNGTLKPPDGLDYIAVSPKVSAKKLCETFKHHKINELRYLIGTDNSDKNKPVEYLPPDMKDLPYADYYYVSPMFNGEPSKKFILEDSNLRKAIDFVKTEDNWRLSVQQHKLWNIL